MELISLGITLLIIISLPTFIAYLLYKWLSKTKIKLLGKLCFIIAPIFTVYVIFRAIYPDDDLFFEEYKTVTLLDAPKTAIVLEKIATYPDFHGNYISVALLELTKSDYSKLYNSLIRDKQIDTLGQLIGSEEFIDVVGEKKNFIKYTFTRTVPKKENSHYSITFLNDHKTVIIYVINS